MRHFLGSILVAGSSGVRFYQTPHVLRSKAWSCFSFRTLANVNTSFVVMLGNISLSDMRPVGPGCVSGQDILLKVAQY